jgi:hypothetical protein
MEMIDPDEKLEIDFTTLPIKSTISIFTEFVPSKETVI